MKSFKSWLENLWGNIPAKGRKPSDGWGQGGQSAPMPSGPPMKQNMKSKVKKK